mmetsp:Transcript_136712/g.437328  ORF Transcript_136712/g.437328 Transcript_136712/m.437328 type:complete len:251 (+) Transcript_136712:301-1053(+)
MTRSASSQTTKVACGLLSAPKWRRPRSIGGPPSRPYSGRAYRQAQRAEDRRGGGCGGRHGSARMLCKFCKSGVCEVEEVATLVVILVVVLHHHRRPGLPVRKDDHLLHPRHDLDLLLAVRHERPLEGHCGHAVDLRTRGLEQTVQGARGDVVLRDPMPLDLSTRTRHGVGSGTAAVHGRFVREVKAEADPCEFLQGDGELDAVGPDCCEGQIHAGRAKRKVRAAAHEAAHRGGPRTKGQQGECQRAHHGH